MSRPGPRPTTERTWHRTCWFGNIQRMLLATLQLLAFTVIAIASVRPTVRRHGALLLGLLALIAVITGLLESAPRTLEITHRFTAYVELAVQPKDFPVETTSAPPGRWAYLCALFCLGWAVWSFRQRHGTPARAFGAPLVLCWTGIGLQLMLERAAAPASLLVPFDLAPDRVMFPATIASALLLARPGRKLLHLIFYLSLFVAVCRLPLAVFGTLATQLGWGTHLDVHAAEYFVPPGSNRGIEVQPGSHDQLFWMVWAPHLVVFPAVYMMSTGGLAFLSLMWQRQLEENARDQS